MRNKLSDLNDVLFEQLERLNDEALTGEKLNEQINRADAMTSLANGVLNIAKVQLDALRLVSHGTLTQDEIPKNLLEK